MHTRLRAILRSLSLKDLRKFYLQYVSPSTDNMKKMRSRLFVQVIVADSDDRDASQSLGDGFSEGSEFQDAHASEADVRSVVSEDNVIGRRRHTSHSGSFGRPSVCGGAGHRVRTSGCVGGGNIWCCNDLRASLLDTSSYEDTSLPSESEVLRSLAAKRITDVEQWKAAQFVYPRSVGNLPQ